MILSFSVQCRFFVANSEGKALDADDRILYNTTTGALFFDADGNGSVAAIEIARLENKAELQASDFILVTNAG